MSKCVVIGVTGGIAVYKALDVISALRKKDIEVHVIMTESASKFVNPLTFQSISQNMVVTDMFAVVDGKKPIELVQNLKHGKYNTYH